MHNLKLHLLYNKIFTDSLYRQISTNRCLLSRRKPVRKSIDDPGIRYQKAIFEDDPEYMKSLEENDEIEPEDSNFMKLDEAYDQHYMEKKKKQELKWKKIVTTKFFSPGSQPLMLTHYEKEQIKLLHREDPIQWNIQTLSESFPATPDIIRKVLKAKWKPSPERQKKMIQQVQKNWELLTEGKLEADPDYIQHLKKFTNRREILLEQDKNPQLLLPEIKDEPKWNKGEMSGILKRYEKELEELERNYFEQKGNKMTTGGSKSLEPSLDAEKDKNGLYQPVENNDKIVRNLQREESRSLEKMINFYKQDLTLQEFQDFVMQKAENKSQLNKGEATILSHLLSKNNYKSENFKPNLGTDLCKGKINNQQRISKTIPKLLQPEHSVKINYEESETENSVHHENLIKSYDEEKEYGINLSEKDFKRLQRKFLYNWDEEKHIPLPDERTKLVSETEIGKLLESNKDLEEKTTKTEEKKQLSEEDKKILEEKELKDKLYFDKEEDDIRDTAFWNSDRTSTEKALSEMDKKPLKGKDISKVTTADIADNDNFPLKIKIPKMKRSSGLIFRVKDCYYDYDGYFLYRIPGMTK